MPYKCLITLLAMILSLVACGQKPQRSASNTSIHKTEQTMDLSKITNERARQAIEAWQQGDSISFLSFFVANARLTDDGHPRDFANFVKTACGHERFTSIDKVENNGLDIYGNFHTESWGDFRTFFKFQLGKEGKFERLDIGQAKY